MEAAWRELSLAGRLLVVALVTGSVYALARLAARLFGKDGSGNALPESLPGSFPASLPASLPASFPGSLPTSFPAERGVGEAAAEAKASVKLYSEKQILVSTAFLSPLGGWTLLVSNLRKLGLRGAAWLAMLAAVLFTAGLLVLAAEAGDARRGLVRPVAEGLSLGATWLVLAVWMRPRLLAHQSAGGAFASSWNALGLSLAGFAVSGALLSAGLTGLTGAGPPAIHDWLNHCVTFSRTAPFESEEICYLDGASEADARALGALLQKLQLFDGKRSLELQVVRSAGKLALAIQVHESAFEDKKVRSAFNRMAKAIADSLPQKEPFELRLCDHDWHARVTLPE
jgi:hypothetical protein